jgi:TPP-dependent indolepyruvate ferredoxin oxidoreductase alpha subunit
VIVAVTELALLVDMAAEAAAEAAVTEAFLEEATQVLVVEEGTSVETVETELLELVDKQVGITQSVPATLLVKQAYETETA